MKRVRSCLPNTSLGSISALCLSIYTAKAIDRENGLEKGESDKCKYGTM
jgi:hypothetical protein